MGRCLRVVWSVVGLVAALASDVSAQLLGTFRWQLQPFCNVVTLNVTLQGGIYTLDGFDDQCGASTRASVVGTAFLNPDGSIGIGLATVPSLSGAPVHVDARIDLGSVSGPWRDSAGNEGVFAFAPGPAIAGPLRPASANGVAPGSITATQLAPGAVGGGQIDPSQVQARVGGMCPVGQYLRGINPNGTVVCDLLLAANGTTVDDTVDEGHSSSGVGFHASIAIGADGLPVISHQELIAGKGALRVTHCGNAACTKDNVSTVADAPATSAGSWTSIAIGVNGLPVISHLDSTASVLRVTHCGNATCTAGNVSTAVDNSFGVGTSIAIGADGLPVISYADFTPHALRVTHCGNATCTSGNVSTTVDGPVNLVGSSSSIAIGVDGLPIISHSDFTAGAVRVTHCGNPACTAGNVSITLASIGSGVTSIAIAADGLPIISHRNEAASALQVTHCGNATCTMGNVVGTLVDPVNAGLSPSITIGADGLPVVSHSGGFPYPVYGSTRHQPAENHRATPEDLNGAPGRRPEYKHQRPTAEVYALG